jgi:hypothetical protein
MSSKPIEKGLRELKIDRSLLVIIFSFVKQVYFMQAPLGDLQKLYGNYFKNFKIEKN